MDWEDRLDYWKTTGWVNEDADWDEEDNEKFLDYLEDLEEDLDE